VTVVPVVRELAREEWPIAAGVAARAFFDEEFIVGMLGTDPFERFVGVQHFYAVEPWDDDAVHLGAFLGHTMVGLIRASPYGRCFVCRHVSPDTPPDDPIIAKDWVFEVEVLRSHEPYVDHGWISRVAVEPALHGTGIGKLLIEGALAALGEGGPGTVLLECLAGREGFYTARGFRRVAEVVDPHADLSYLMRVDLPRLPSS
jgi:GNAT superfamily N-acetyltransferase